MLRNGNSRGRMVGRCHDRTEPIVARGKTTGHRDGYVALIIGGSVDAFEERKHGRVQRCG